MILRKKKIETPAVTDQPALAEPADRITLRLRKLARLQGFVTEAQIHEIAPSDEEFDRAQAVILDEGITINTFVKEPPRKTAQAQHQKTPPFADTTWLYLNSIGKIPLLSRDQEIEYAMRMDLAQGKLFDMAFRSDTALKSLFALCEGLENNSAECGDVLRMDEETSKDQEAQRAMRGEFLKTVAIIKTKYNAAAEAQAADTPESLNRAETLLDEIAALCKSLTLNPMQIDSILKKYRISLISENLTKEAGIFSRLEEERNIAKCAIIEANVRLVVSIAKRFTQRGMEIVDLIQEGNHGLIKAVESFDYRKGYKFSTYATWWIRQSIYRAINDKAKAIRVPSSTMEFVNKVMRHSRKWILKYGYEPSYDELAGELGCSRAKIMQALDCSIDPISLDMDVGGQNGTTYGEYIEDTKVVDPADKMSLLHLRELIKNALDALAPKEREVLVMRYGLDDGQVKTLKEVGEAFDISRERVRQIETTALDKLKHPTRVKPLEPWSVERKETMADVSDSPDEE